MQKYVIFDLDDTLIHEGFESAVKCSDSLEVLELAKKKHYIICVATLNADAVNLCKQTDLYKYIDLIVAIDIESKLRHFQIIKEHYNCESSQIIVFDDVAKHIFEAESIGIKSYLVNWVTGVTLDNAKLL